MSEYFYFNILYLINNEYILQHRFFLYVFKTVLQGGTSTFRAVLPPYIRIFYALEYNNL